MDKADEKLLKDAAWTVLMFDRLNTNDLVKNIGSRGILLRDAVEDLRVTLGGTQAVWDLTRDMGHWNVGYFNQPAQWVGGTLNAPVDIVKRDIVKGEVEKED